MADQKKTRQQKLAEFLARNPNDTFSRYGIALECTKQGDLATADSHFRILLQNHPDYVPAYQMYAQLLVQQERINEAKRVLTIGMAAATRQGNHHAHSEMEALLSELH
jgi:predicted Zn-dependent protease